MNNVFSKAVVEQKDEQKPSIWTMKWNDTSEHVIVFYHVGVKYSCRHGRLDWTAVVTLIYTTSP